MMVYTDMSISEIAEELNISERTIYRYKLNPEFIKQKDDTEREYLQSLRAKSLRTMNELLNSDKQGVRFSAAKDILDRTGLKATESVTFANIPTIIFGEDDLED